MCASVKCVLELNTVVPIRTFGPETREYELYSPAIDFNWGPMFVDYDTPLHELHEALDSGLIEADGR
jgi:hypothetical protein